MATTDRLLGISGGAALKTPVVVASTGNLTLSGAQTVDGISVGNGERVLVRSQTSSTDNGIYDTKATAWTRSRDFDGDYDAVPGTLVYVDRGTANGDSFWTANSSSTATKIAIGATEITWTAITPTITDASNGLVTATGSTAARTLAARFAEIYNVKDYGAVGDGVTDDATAIQAAFDAGEATTSRAVAFYFPPGEYLMGSQAVFNAGNGSENGAVLLGAGRTATKIIAAEANSTGCIKLVGDTNEQVFIVKSMSFVSTRDQNTEYAANNGTALYIASSLAPTDGGYGSRLDFSVLVEDVDFGGDAANPGDYDNAGIWEYALRLDYVWYPVITNCFFKGGDPSLGIANMRTGSNYTAAIYCKHCYDPHIIHSYVSRFWETGIRLEGTTTTGNSFEGTMIDNTNIVGPLEGIYLSHATSPKPSNIYEPGVHVVGCHINPVGHGIRIDTHRQIVIEGNYFYVTSSTEDTDYAHSALPASIFLDNAGDVSVVGNQFLEPGFYTSNTDSAVAVRVEGTLARGILIASNLFNHGGISIRVETSDTQESVVSFGNHWGGQQTGSWATNVRYHDPNGVGSLTILDLENDAGGNTDKLHLKSYKTGAGASPEHRITRLRSDYAGTTAAVLGQLGFYGLDSAGNEDLAAAFRADWDDNTSTSEDTSLKVYAKVAGSNSQEMNIGSGVLFGSATGGRKGSGTTNQTIAYLNNIPIQSGSGTPESAVTAPVGSLFLRTDGGASTTFYVKESGTGSTGWVAK